MTAPDYGVVSDGLGTEESRCGPDCTLEVVRPGKTQCVDLQTALDDPDWPPPCARMGGGVEDDPVPTDPDHI